MTYVLAAILAGTQYHKSGSNPYILAGLIIGLLPALALFCLICIAHREKETIQILTIIFILLGIFSIIAAILIFVGNGQEAKKSNSDPEYNQAQVIAAGVLFTLSSVFHCIGFGLCGLGCLTSESSSSEDQSFH